MSNRRFATYIFSIPVVAGLLLALVADAGAADTRTETRKLADGSTQVCTYQTSFGQTTDGSHIIRKAWRCVRTASK